MPSQNINKKLGIPALNYLTSVVLNKIGSHVCWNKIGHFMILSPHFLQQKLLFSYLCWFNVGYLGPEIIIAYIVKSDAWNILSNNVFIQMWCQCKREGQGWQTNEKRYNWYLCQLHKGKIKYNYSLCTKYLHLTMNLNYLCLYI